MPPEERGKSGRCSWTDPPLGSLHPPQRVAQQFRRRREVPVGVGDMGVSEISRERGQTSLDIDTAAMPMEECADSQAMTKIMQTRAPRVARAAQADLAKQLDERPADAPLRQTSAAFGEEKAWAVGGGT